MKNQQQQIDRSFAMENAPNLYQLTVHMNNLQRTYGKEFVNDIAFRMVRGNAFPMLSYFDAKFLVVKTRLDSLFDTYGEKTIANWCKITYGE